MTPLVGILFLFIIAYLGSYIHEKYRNSSGWLKFVLYSGSLNLIVGYLIGPNAFGLLSGEIISNLYVLVGLVLGWAGFLIGLQVNRAQLKRFQTRYYLFSGLNFILVFVGMSLLIRIFLYVSDLSLSPSLIFLLAVLGSVSSPILVGLLRQQLSLRGAGIHLLQFSVALDNIFSVIFFGLLLLLVQQETYEHVLFVWLIPGSLLFSVIMSWLFIKISRMTDSVHQFLLILIGFLLILVGVALSLNVSVLLIAFVFGVALTNMPVETKKLYQGIAQAEKPLYYLMMVFIGASIHHISIDLFFVALAFMVVRIILKFFAGNIARRAFSFNRQINSGIGLPQIGMGGIALAMVLDFHLSVSNILSDSVMFIVSVMAIGNAILSTAVTKKNISG